MGKLIPNNKTLQFDFVDKEGKRVPSVGNILHPKEIVKSLDAKSGTLITLETIENGTPRSFDIEATALASQQTFANDIHSNGYFINYKMYNPLREYTSLAVQRLQNSGLVKYKHKSLGFFRQQNGTKIFLLGKTLTKHGISSYCDEKFEFKKGDVTSYEKFLDDEILPHKETQLALSIGLSSVLASYLKDYADVQTIVTNFCGPSSSGKTTMSQFVASLWANPKISNSSLVKTFNSTHIARFTRIEGFNGVPIILDDATTASYLNRADLIYQLAQGESRDRATNYGRSVSQGLTWSGLALITSETPVLSDSETRLGLMARVLDFEDICWTQDGNHAKRIKNAIFNNYGFIGQKFVQGFLKLSDQELEKGFLAAQVEISEAIPIKDELSNRIINKLAIILMTSQLIEKILGIKLKLDSIKKILVEQDQKAVKDRHIGLKAYEVIKNYITKHHTKFDKYDSNNVYKASAKGSLMGILKYSSHKVMASIPSKSVEDILKASYIYEFSTVRKYWAKNNLILTQSGKTAANVRGLSSRAIRFLFDKVEDTILPWYDPDNFPLETNDETETPLSIINYNDKEAVEEIFKDEE